MIVSTFVAVSCAVLASAIVPSEPLVSDPGFAAMAQDSSGELVTVRVKGQGSTPAAAKEDATRQGLMQAVGMFVDVQQVTDGDRLVKDRILGATAALVTGSKVVAGPTRLGDGAYEVECDVRIRRRSLVGALSDAGFSVTGGIDGDSAVRAAEANFRNAQEAETLLAERLSGLWSKLLVGRLLDDAGAPLGTGELPTVVKKSDGTVVVCANVQVYFHLEAFYTRFVPELQPLLEALSKGRGQLTWNRRAEDVQSSRFGSIPSRKVDFNGDPADTDLSGLASKIAWAEQPGAPSPSEFLNLMLSVGRDGTALTEQFEVYRLPASLGAAILGAARQLSAGQVRLELLAADGSVVSSKVFAPMFATLRSSNPAATVAGYPEGVPFSGGLDSGMGGQLAAPMTSASLWNAAPALLRSPKWPGLELTLLLSPAFLLCDTNGTPKHWTDAIELRLELTMSPSDLEGVTAYRITAVEGRPRPQ